MSHYFLPDIYFKNRTLQPGLLHKALLNALSSADIPSEMVKIDIAEGLPDGSYHDQDLTLDETRRLCSLGTSRIRIYAGSEDKVSLFIYGMNGGEILHVSRFGSDAQKARIFGDAVIRELELQEVPEEPGWTDRLDALEERLQALEQIISPRSTTLRCFLSYRFTGEIERLANTLEHFFSLLDIAVVTGAGYEPRPIVEKVKAKLGSDLDFIVLVVAVNGESLWTRDEISSAGARGVPVIPLVEEGATFAPGLFGDLEYIPFSTGRIEECLIKLLEAIRFVRLQKSADLSGQSESEKAASKGR